MKKIFLLIIVLLSTSTTFAQKIINNPDYGMSSLPGDLTKIELTTEATILHFHIKYQPGNWITILKASHLKDVKGGEKYAVIKSDSIPLETKYTMPKSGEVRYKLYFPKIDSTVNKIDFIEGDWAIYDIVINETEPSLLPKALQGNWLQTDGSNQFDYGFYGNQAVVGKTIWNYKTVEKKKNNYTIILEKDGKQKTVYAQTDKKGGVKFGEDKEKLIAYSTEKVENPNYKLANDNIYSSNVFKSDSATYSGYIKGYTARAGKKTGTISVSNHLTGSQESYLIKIADDGSFSIKFTINHPQSIFVRLPSFSNTVFLEPGKETFQVIDKETSLFMGDMARINQDLKVLEKAESYQDYQNLRKTVLEMKPEDFKKACLDIKDMQLQVLNTVAQKQFVSQKAIQITKMDIEFLAFAQIFSYESYRDAAERDKTKNNKEQEDVFNENLKLETSYYDFITKSMLENEAAVVSNNFSYFASNLANVEALSEYPVFPSLNNMADMAKILREYDTVLTNDELEMITAYGKGEKADLRLLDFKKANKTKIDDFNKKYKEAYEEVQKNKSKDDISIGDLAAYLKKQRVVLTPEESELIANYKLIQLSKEELVVKKAFGQKYGKRSEDFGKKYMDKIQNILSDLYSNKTYNKMKEVYGLNEAFFIDAMILRQKTQNLDKNFTPYTVNQLQTIQEKIKHPFLSNYIVLENNKMKVKLEANKTKTGFAVNTVKKTEGDELFESMIAKFKGKVVYVDFWATWCGPCMSGIKEIAPLKEEMKNHDVVFLYITGETSPLKTWENSIPNIKGEHYRVSQDEWNYLTSKFNISGIPHYVLVNKKGEVVNPKLGHHSNESLKVILERQM